ncbi:MAG: Gldg family protein [Acidobacteria bacterium]|jgi:ABC-2 type transport system permease protein|nr:Gldg family protein [Acidobacteriota bacterium]
MNARRYLIFSTLLAGVLLLAGNIAAQKLLAGARADFTEGGLYTLSHATRATLEDISEPVDLTFAYSRKVGQAFPAVQAHAARVRELLASYQAASGGRIRVREIDPSPFSEAEDEALAAGIAAVPSGGNDPLYFGIIGRNTIDDVRILPFLAPEQDLTLEYDLTRMIARLNHPEPPRVGILSSLQGMATPDPAGGYALLQDIARTFEIDPLPEDFSALPEGLDVLLVAHPPPLSSRQEWLIDQYLLRGGRAVFLVDPAAKIAVTGDVFGISSELARSSLGRLGRAWGVELASDAVADAAFALPVPVETANGRVEELAHPLFIGVPAAAMNREDPITADLMREVNFGAPGALVVGTPPPGVTLTPLIMTGPSPSYINAGEAARDMPPAEVLRNYKSLPAPLPLAMRVSGLLVSAFPSGAPAIDTPRDPAAAEAARAAAAALPPHIRAGERPAEIVIISDADFIADEFYIVEGGGVAVADNGALVLNALDALAGGGELSRLRSRAPALRPMTRIDNMRSAAEEQYFRQQEELESRLTAAQARLAELQGEGTGDGFFAGDLEAQLNDEERSELTALREDILALRARLRATERDYRRGIDQLEGTLKALNIWGGPVLVTLAGLIVWRRQKRPRRPAA